MPKNEEIRWEVGKKLTQETWTKGEFVQSEVYHIPDFGSLQIYFYPAGVEGDEPPRFLLVRSKTRLDLRMKVLNIQLYHGDTLAADFILDYLFGSGKLEAIHSFKDYPTLQRLMIFHSLPELCYLVRFIIERDPNMPEPVLEPQPDPGIIESGINYVLSYFWK